MGRDGVQMSLTERETGVALITMGRTRRKDGG